MIYLFLQTILLVVTYLTGCFDVLKNIFSNIVIYQFQRMETISIWWLDVRSELTYTFTLNLTFHFLLNV